MQDTLQYNTHVLCPCDSLQNEAVKREQFHEKFNEISLDLLEQLGQLSHKHGDLYRLKAGINIFKQLKAGEPGSRVQDILKKIEMLPPFPTSIDSSEPDGVESLKRKQKESAKAASELSEALQGEIRKESLIRQKNYNTLNRMIEEVKQEPNLEEAYNIYLKDETQLTYSDFWDSIADTIASIKTNYVDFYSSLMLQYADFYQAYTELQSKAASAVSEGKDGNYIKWNNSVMDTAFTEFASTIDGLDKNLGTVPQWDQLSATERQQMAATLKPAFAVDMTTGKITFDRSALTGCPKRPSGGSDVDMASYNAWLAAFNSMGNTFQSNMQAFSQRYTQANSTFDNLNKVLSSSITALLECAKAFLSN
ncbi:IpaD/SipD/SspD family type III secretion system needle tip protein [Candidatus Sodalis sp. SoCistrobi]|uniref:IpaD/SipD/SspD family type III secretion system needle tip protein n=1 Tax=Candidatus Sodalis sp. SoCistrobi TaxID=1922216 RepID=UPI0009FC0B66|nr:IpaD/SipD/SspD family type III secretion system needle tip protein [Candidatus Sodalis sp. SoCistrobi]